MRLTVSIKHNIKWKVAIYDHSAAFNETTFKGFPIGHLSFGKTCTVVRWKSFVQRRKMISFSSLNTSADTPLFLNMILKNTPPIFDLDPFHDVCTSHV